MSILFIRFETRILLKDSSTAELEGLSLGTLMALSGGVEAPRLTSLSTDRAVAVATTSATAETTF